MHKHPVWAGAIVASLLPAVGYIAPARAEGAYHDGPTSEWFAGLASAYTQHCCDQADCKLAMSDYHDGAWWALSNRTHTWVRIDNSQITSTVSIFKDAVLCEGEPLLTYAAGGSNDYQPRVYCFAPPPLGF